MCGIQDELGKDRRVVREVCDVSVGCCDGFVVDNIGARDAPTARESHEHIVEPRVRLAPVAWCDEDTHLAELGLEKVLWRAPNVASEMLREREAPDADGSSPPLSRLND
jgi:hypothetical protein